MGGALFAARVGDQVGNHGSGWSDFWKDVAIGVAAGLAVIAVAALVVCTGGLAVGPLMCCVVGFTALSATLGVTGGLAGIQKRHRLAAKNTEGGGTHRGTASCSNVAGPGSPNVYVEGLKVARANLESGNHGNVLITQGAKTVIVNNAPLVREGDSVKCGGMIIHGCEHTLIGGPSVGEVTDDGPSDNLIKWIKYGSAISAGIATVAALAAAAAGAATVEAGLWIVGRKLAGSGAMVLAGHYLHEAVKAHYGEDAADYTDMGVSVALSLVGSLGVKGLGGEAEVAPTAPKGGGTVDPATAPAGAPATAPAVEPATAPTEPVTTGPAEPAPTGPTQAAATGPATPVEPGPTGPAQPSTSTGGASGAPEGGAPAGTTPAAATPTTTTPEPKLLTYQPTKPATGASPAGDPAAPSGATEAAPTGGGTAPGGGGGPTETPGGAAPAGSSGATTPGGASTAPGGSTAEAPAPGGGTSAAGEVAPAGGNSSAGAATKPATTSGTGEPATGEPTTGEPATEGTTTDAGAGTKPAGGDATDAAGATKPTTPATEPEPAPAPKGDGTDPATTPKTDATEPTTEPTAPKGDPTEPATTPKDGAPEETENPAAAATEDADPSFKPGKAPPPVEETAPAPTEPVPTPPKPAPACPTCSGAAKAPVVPKEEPWYTKPWFKVKEDLLGETAGKASKWVSENFDKELSIKGIKIGTFGQWWPEPDGNAILWAPEYKDEKGQTQNGFGTPLADGTLSRYVDPHLRAAGLMAPEKEEGGTEGGAPTEGGGEQGAPPPPKE